MSSKSLSGQSLKDLIAERTKQGRHRNSQARLVALRLGKRTPKKHGAYHDYKDEHLTIEFDDYGPNLSISWKGKRVLTNHLRSITSFIPGEWEQHLESLYLPLAAEETRKEEEKKVKKRKELLDRWGLEGFHPCPW